VTWLPLKGDSRPERDAVFGLKEDVYSAFRETLAIGWRMTDPHLLALCRLRLAQLASARAELAEADEDLLARLEAWESSAEFSEPERVALSFAEQYHYDHTRLEDGRRSALAAHVSIANFTWALHMNDAYIRALSLLDVERDPPGSPHRRESAPRSPMPSSARTPLDAPLDGDFSAAQTTLNRTTVRQSLVDDVTSEAIRLHNAAHQGCLY
jgi:hypothetical protein